MKAKRNIIQEPFIICYGALFDSRLVISFKTKMFLVDRIAKDFLRKSHLGM